MTTDAKVGLLLGLVFIVIIAFLINGLPNFVSQAAAEGPETALGNFEGKTLVISPASNETIRAIERSVPLRLSTPPQEERFKQTNVAKAIGHRQDKPAPQSRPATAGPGRTPQSYTVRSGDNLAVIAIKVYGAEKGNKTAVVDRIFSANRSVLASPDRLVVGQKLVIPAISSQAPLPGAERVIPATGIFDRLKNAFKNTVNKPAARLYVVRAGDNLWKIATSVLGDGNRYREIEELNGDVIANVDDIYVGMSLKLPHP